MRRRALEGRQRQGTKNAATASEFTIFASADNGATSSYQPIDEERGDAASTGSRRCGNPPPSAAAAAGAGRDGHATEGGRRRAVPAFGARRDDGAARMAMRRTSQPPAKLTRAARDEAQGRGGCDHQIRSVS